MTRVPGGHSVMKRLVPFVVVIVWGVAQITPANAGDLTGMGIVLMHGKGGRPGSLLGPLADSLRKDGAVVVTPEMPWSHGRIYDASYQQAIAQIESIVAGLRKRGLAKIVVGGQSIGANAAIGYGVRHGDVAAIMAIAPGHNPNARGFLKHTAASVHLAKQLVADGKGDIKRTFADFNTGSDIEVRATPKVYLSYLDPDGPAVMPRNAAMMKPVPFLMAIGRQDQLYPRARELIYDKAAKHPKSKYVEVGGGHKDTGRLAVGPIVNWLKSL